MRLSNFLIPAGLSLSAVFALSSCGSSSNDRRPSPVQTASLVGLQQFEDYAPYFAENGEKAVFLSKRDDGVAKAYFYDASTDKKLTLLSEKMGLDPKAGFDALAALSDSGDILGLVRSSASGEGSLHLVQNSSGAKAQLNLPEGAFVGEMAFAKGLENYLAYVLTLDGKKILKILKVEVSGAILSSTEVGSFEGESDFRLAFINGALRLLSAKASSAELSRGLVLRTFDEAQSTWTTNSDSQSIAASDLSRRFSLNAKGLFTVQKLSPVKIRNKSGSSPTVGQDIVSEKVVISDKIVQSDLFGVSQSLDFSSAQYLTQESTNVSSLSSSPDGEILLISGYDAYSCVAGARQYSIIKIVRSSDMKTLPLVISRTAGTQSWANLSTDACALFDNPAGLEVDPSVQRADYIGRNGDVLHIALHSFVTGDEEIRLLKAKFDFDSGTVSDVSIQDISGNPRR